MKRIGIVTGTRAEYGLLKPVIERIKADSELDMCLIVTGAHLEKEYGLTYREIEEDGYSIDYKVNMKLSIDTPYRIVYSMGLELMGFADVYRKAKLDMLVLLGDRYELGIAAIAAVLYHIPIAHIHGGELTEGAVDDAIRHAVTKMSQIHFTSTPEYYKRVIQMGEEQNRVFCVGALGVENIKRLPLYTRGRLIKKFGSIFSEPYILITYHPVTLENNQLFTQFQNILDVVSAHKEFKYVFTYANSDEGGKTINYLIQEYIDIHKDTAKAFISMGAIGYLSALRYCEVVLGNSSSGIIEAPSFQIPTVNIGERQSGRVKAGSVIDCGYCKEEIDNALIQAISQEFRNKCKCISNPYEGKETSKSIVDEIKNYLFTGNGIKKRFHDIELSDL